VSLRGKHLLAQIIYIIFCGAFLTIGSIIIVVYALPYSTNNVHENITVVIDFYFAKSPTWFHFIIKTSDAMIANNPIDLKISTTLIDLDQVSQIQITLEGAEKAFEGSESIMPKPPPAGSSENDYSQYVKAMDKYAEDYRKYFDEKMKSDTSNIFHLSSDRSYDDMVKQEQEINKLRGLSSTQTNITFPKFSTFSGSIKNVTYAVGGKFDVGLTFIGRNGIPVGYGMSDISYALNDVLEISPPEVKLQIKSNNLTTGLSYIAVGIAILFVAINGFMEIMKHYAFP
jgi:hypothetical protein